MYNKNYLVNLKGNKVVSIISTNNSIKPRVFDKWNYLHENGQIFKEDISYGFESNKGDEYNNIVVASFYSDMPLKGFEFNSLGMGINFEQFVKNCSITYIPGSWCTPSQQEYNSAMADNYFMNRE